MRCINLHLHYITASRLQPILHAAAHYAARRRDHVTPLLHQLHWLSVPERVEFKINSCVVAYRCLHGPWDLNISIR